MPAREFIVNLFKEHEKKKFHNFRIGNGEKVFLALSLIVLILLCSLYYSHQQVCSNLIEYQLFDPSCDNFDTPSSIIHAMAESEVKEMIDAIQVAGRPDARYTNFPAEEEGVLAPNALYNCSDLWSAAYFSSFHLVAVPSGSPLPNSIMYVAYFALTRHNAGLGFSISYEESPVSCNTSFHVTFAQNRSSVHGNSSIMAGGTYDPKCVDLMSLASDSIIFWNTLSTSFADGCYQFYLNPHLMRCKVCSSLDTRTMVILILLALAQGASILFQITKFVVNRRNKVKDDSLLDMEEQSAANQTLS